MEEAQNVLHKLLQYSQEKKELLAERIWIIEDNLKLLRADLREIPPKITTSENNESETAKEYKSFKINTLKKLINTNEQLLDTYLNWQNRTLKDVNEIKAIIYIKITA